MTSRGTDAAIERVDASAFTIPTEEPESDGTLDWDSTTMVVVELRAADVVGTGWSYAAPATARLIDDHLVDTVTGHDAMDLPGIWEAMNATTRNLGRPGVVSHAMAAVDTAAWDLKARLLDLPLASLFGRVTDVVPVYGSGGFTSYSLDRLAEQLGGWADAGFPAVKMKVGREPWSDSERVRAVREAIGDADLMVDANGAYDRKEALAMADALSDQGVIWFEEPVSSDDLEGLRLLRDRAPAGMEVTAGEYGYHLFYFRRMLDAGAVDVLQADATRCGGFTGYLRTGAQCRARNVPLSAHASPSLHLHVCPTLHPTRHIEWFHDHVRIERMLLDGFVEPVDGALAPDLSRAGNGYTFRHMDAREYRVYAGGSDG